MKKKVVLQGGNIFRNIYAYKYETKNEKDKAKQSFGSEYDAAIRNDRCTKDAIKTPIQNTQCKYDAVI